MIGLDLKDITRISKDVGAYEVYESINQTLQNSDFQILIIKSFEFSFKLWFLMNILLIVF